MIGETAAGESNSDNVGGTVGEKCGLMARGSEDSDKQMKKARNKAGVKKQAVNWKKPKGTRLDEMTEGASDDDWSVGMPAWGRVGVGTVAGQVTGTRGGTMRPMAYGALVAVATDCESAGVMAIVPSMADFCG